MSRHTVLHLGVIGLLWFCTIAGCNKVIKSSSAQAQDLVLSVKEVTLTQGFGTEPIAVNNGLGSESVKIDGEKDGVTASYKDGLIGLSAAKDAKLGQIELIVSNKAGKMASLKVTVRAPVDTMAGANLAHPRVDVEQGQEVTAPFFIDKKLVDANAEVSISAGKDGLSAKVVPGDENFGFKVSAVADAKPGEQELTIKAGKVSDTLTVTVKAATPK